MERFSLPGTVSDRLRSSAPHMRSVRKNYIIRQRHLRDGFLKAQGTSTFAIVNPECPMHRDKVTNHLQVCRIQYRTTSDSWRFLPNVISLLMFKSRLRDILIQEWVSDINTSCKANHYRNFYGSFEIQFYLKNTLPVYLTRILAKLRCSAHELKVEKGRHNGTPHFQRMCVFCRNNQIEDEFHFVLFYNAHSFTT